MKGQSDIIFWILMGLLILWVILKGSGIIQTPTLFEVSPFVLIILTIYYVKNEIRKDMIKVIQPFREEVNSRFEKVENKLSGHDKILVEHTKILGEHEGIMKTILQLLAKKV